MVKFEIDTPHMKPKRIGLLGGTFNPIHMGHLHIATEVSKCLELNQVLFIPTGIPPHKDPKGILPALDRLKMVELALLEIPQFVPCDIEIKRSGESYTIETILELKEKHPDDHLFFIVGMDAFSQIETWKTPEKLVMVCDFAIISRPLSPFSSLPSYGLLSLADRSALGQLDAGKIQDYDVSVSPRSALHFLNIPHSTISASHIRAQFSEGKIAKNFLPASVQSYIIKNQLYKGESYF